jgi:arylsulfatase A-like enzyme
MLEHWINFHIPEPFVDNRGIQWQRDTIQINDISINHQFDVDSSPSEINPTITKPGGRCLRPVSFIDIFPTLIDICGLSPKKELEGKSLLSLLKNPKASWQRPALTTHGRNNHSLRSERWRYIRYSDGTEELYDHDRDELEWNNLANDPKYADIKKELAKWLPETNVPDVTRIRTKRKR